MPNEDPKKGQLPLGNYLDADIYDVTVLMMDGQMSFMILLYLRL